jgi:hypothetical protein
VVAAQPSFVRALAITVLVPACFYVEPINQRPSIAIVEDSSTPIHRGEMVSLESTVHDPDSDPVAVSWRIYACTDATEPAGCDNAPFFTSTFSTISFKVPPNRTNEHMDPVAALRVILQGVDDHGATAEPDQELLIAVTDRAPTLQLRTDAPYNFVVHTPVNVYAQVADPDDDPAQLALATTFTVLGPSESYALTDIVLTDPTQSGRKLVADDPGSWTVRVAVADSSGATAMQDAPIQIVPDHAPCLSSWAPLAPPPGQTLPMADPTLFEVLVVTDDLDPYPPPLADPIRGTTAFAWSLLAPGDTTFQSLAGVIGNSVPLDPASYNTGDVLELRVEIQDRVPRLIDCAESDPTCSVISDPTCIQRLTWTVEVQ